MYDRFGHAGLGGAATGGFDPDRLHRLRGHPRRPRRHLRLRRYVRRRPAARRPAARRRPALRPRDLVRRVGEGRRDDDPDSAAAKRARPASGNGAAPGSQADDVPAVPGPRPAALSAGLLHRRAHLRPVPRHRHDHQPSRARLPRRGTRAAGAQAHGARFPPGIATGQRLRLSGEGEAGAGGGPAGDLYVVVHVQEHAFFHRDGNDLFCEIPLNFPTLALGGEIRIPTLEGEETFKVPEGTQTRRDVPSPRQGHARRRADAAAATCCVTVKVVTPKKLTKEQRKLLEQLADDAAEGEVRADAARRSTTTAACSTASKTSSARVTKACAPGRRWKSTRPTPTPAISSRRFSPTSMPPRSTITIRGVSRVFFHDSAERDRAANALQTQISRPFTMRSIDMPDEDWAARSQAALHAIQVGTSSSRRRGMCRRASHVVIFSHRWASARGITRRRACASMRCSG